jgi:hypothetical protein
MLGWGVLDPPVLTMTGKDGVVWIDDTLTHAVEHLGLHTAYETETEYLVIPLAVSNEVLQAYWGLPGLPDWCPPIAPRQARMLDIPTADVGTLLGQYRGNLAQVWQEAQHIYTELGLYLPSPRLILLSDWD